MTRLFISINLQEEVKSKLSELQQKLKEQFDFLPLKWENVDKLHLTLFFIGETDESNISKIENKLSEIKFNKITLQTREITTFPKVLILKLTNPDKNLFALQEHITEKLNELGFKSVHKHFKPHITLARLKDNEKFATKPGRGRIELPQEVFKHIDFDINFSVNSFYLMKSILNREGAEHNVIKEFKTKIPS
jgi:2'-5' RNA ligase